MRLPTVSFRPIRKGGSVAAAAILLVSSLGTAPAARASGTFINVDTTSQSINSDAACSLEEAIYSINYHDNVAPDPSDLVNGGLIRTGCESNTFTSPRLVVIATTSKTLHSPKRTPCSSARTRGCFASFINFANGIGNDLLARNVLDLYVVHYGHRLRHLRRAARVAFDSVDAQAMTKADRDTIRLDWLMRNISGRECRENLGIIYSNGVTRESIDAAMGEQQPDTIPVNHPAYRAK